MHYEKSQGPYLENVGFDVLASVVMKFAIFWDIVPSIPYVNRRFEGTYHLQHRNRK
jgi:hypothetical protein